MRDEKNSSSLIPQPYYFFLGCFFAGVGVVTAPGAGDEVSLGAEGSL